MLCGVERIAEMCGRDVGWAVERMKALVAGLRVPVAVTAEMVRSAAEQAWLL